MHRHTVVAFIQACGIGYGELACRGPCQVVSGKLPLVAHWSGTARHNSERCGLCGGRDYCILRLGDNGGGIINGESGRLAGNRAIQCTGTHSIGTR